MPPRRRPVQLALDVDKLRSALDAGKLVRVLIAPSGQFPEGATGRVRSIGNPAVDGDEFLAVEVGAGSSRDVLPFAPSDLQPYSRKGSSGVTSPSDSEAPATVGNPASARAISTNGSTGGRRTAGGTDLFAVKGPALVSSRPAAGGAATAGGAAASGPPPHAEAIGGDAPAPSTTSSVRASRSAGSRATRGKLPAVTITVSTDGENGWKIEARVGSRIAVRATAVSPARVAEIAGQLEDPRLIEVVTDLLAEHRRTVQARADALAAELAAVRAELETYP